MTHATQNLDELLEQKTLAQLMSLARTYNDRRDAAGVEVRDAVFRAIERRMDGAEYLAFCSEL